MNWYTSSDTWNTSIFTGQSIATLLSDSNDTGQDTGDDSLPITVPFQDADLLFEDVQYGHAMGDIDGDGLDEIVLSNYSMNYAAYRGGIRIEQHFNMKYKETGTISDTTQTQPDTTIRH